MTKWNGTATTTTPNKYYEISTSTGTTVKSIFTPDGELIATIKGTGATTTREYIHGDHLGSTNAVTNSPGAIVSSVSYYPYGQERISSGNDSTDRHYIGERTDAETSQNYLNNRYYVSTRGQFLSQDPVVNALGTPELQQLMPAYIIDANGIPQSVSQNILLANPQMLNTYSYSLNNPIRYKDPTGKSSLAIPGGVIGGAIGGPPGAIIGMGVGVILTPVAIWGAGELGKWIANINQSQKGKDKGTPKPSDAPSGTKPIDQVGLQKGQAHEIKKGIEAGPKDWTGITPKGDVITGTPNGKTINHGPADTYTQKPTGLVK